MEREVTGLTGAPADMCGPEPMDRRNGFADSRPGRSAPPTAADHGSILAQRCAAVAPGHRSKVLRRSERAPPRESRQLRTGAEDRMRASVPRSAGAIETNELLVSFVTAHMILFVVALHADVENEAG